MIYAFCRFWCVLVAKLCYRHKTFGREHFPKGGGLIASNHNSYLDPPLIGVSSPNHIHYLGRDTLFRFKPFGWLLRNVNTHPVKRGGGNVHAFRKAVALIKNGKKVVIFPEGRRSADGELQKGQNGIGLLVQRSGCQVIPVYTHGTYEVWGRKKRFPRLFGHTACVIGSVLTFDDLKELDKKEAQRLIVERIMGKIAELRTWYLAGNRTGSPP